MNEHCEDFREKLEDMVSRELPPEERDAVDRHLAECPECRNYHRALKKDDQSLGAFAASMDGLEARIEDAVRAGDPVKLDVPRKSRFWGRPVVRIAAAAAIIAAIVLVSNPFDSLPPRDVVWAEVAEKIENPPSYIARWQIFRDGKLVAEGARYRSPELGQRIEGYREGSPTLRSIYDLKSNTRTYTDFRTRVSLRDSIGPDSRYNPQKDAHLRKMREFMERDHVSLGISEINGIVVSGIECVDTLSIPGRPTRVRIRRIYADVETQLPVLFENRSVNDTTGDYRRGEYQWYPQFKPDDFDPPIPDDFFVTDLREPIEIIVERARNGLQNFAKIAGRYPENTGFRTLRQEVAAELERLKKENAYSPEIEDSLNTILHVGVLRRWKDHVPRERWSPSYGDYDPSVVPGDSDKILLRWKMFDKAGLIYGDLRFEITDSEPFDEIDRKRWEEYLEKSGSPQESMNED
jgi:hypothetical protein